MDRETISKTVEIFQDAPGYLLETGWLRSMSCRQAVDAEGFPIPWITYPALDFLKRKISGSMTVFEYGSGNSTLWWSRRVNRVVSCEHDKEWYAAMRSRMPANTTYLLRRAKGSSAYADEITNYVDAFDILVIDGRDRINCARKGVGALHADGVILWDNSDREEYEPGYGLLVELGFRRLDFWGMGPLSTRRWCTSFFYRAHNCLAI